jgi:hypothetical protein
MWIKILRWLLSTAGFNIYTSSVRKGVRIGGTDIIAEPDRFVILEISFRGVEVFAGYWQTS